MSLFENDDLMFIITKYIDQVDFVHLTSTCHALRNRRRTINLHHADLSCVPCDRWNMYAGTKDIHIRQTMNMGDLSCFQKTTTSKIHMIACRDFECTLPLLGIKHVSLVCMNELRCIDYLALAKKVELYFLPFVHDITPLANVHHVVVSHCDPNLRYDNMKCNILEFFSCNIHVKQVYVKQLIVDGCASITLFPENNTITSLEIIGTKIITDNTPMHGLKVVWIMMTYALRDSLEYCDAFAYADNIIFQNMFVRYQDRHYGHYVKLRTCWGRVSNAFDTLTIT